MRPSRALLMCLLLAVAMLPGKGSADSTHIPTGPLNNWSYGWKPSPFGSFTPLSNRTTYYGLPAWNLPGGSIYPIVAFNNTGKKVVGTNFGIPPNQLLLHPSNDGKMATVRWVAQSGDRYMIQGLFNGLQTCGSTRVHVVLNSTTTLFTGSTSGAAITTFTVEHPLASGDVLDFVVDDGGNGYTCDPVGLAVMITNLF